MTNMNFPEDSPLALIKTHLNQKDTGEVVSFDGNSEIHVYLQNGFIAWATHSKAKFSFTRHLLEDVGLDKDSLKEVIKECRRTGKKIGEALIEWKLATPEQVTQALRVQVRDAVGALQTQSDPRSLFLPRSGSFADYDETITFSLEEILEPPKVAQVSETPEYIPEDQAEDQAEDRAEDQAEDRAEDQAEDQAEDRAEDRAEVMESNDPEESLEESQAPSEPQTEKKIWIRDKSDSRTTPFCKDARAELGSSPILDKILPLSESKTDLIAIRSNYGQLIGVPDPESSEALWFGFPAKHPIGPATNRLLKHSTHNQPTPNTPALQNQWKTNGSDLFIKDFSDHLNAAASNADELVSVFLFSDHTLVGSTHRDGFDLDTNERYVKNLTQILQAVLENPLGISSISHEVIAYDTNSILASFGPFWYFGVTANIDPKRFLWLVVDRSSPVGLGWALMTSIQRQFQNYGS